MVTRTVYFGKKEDRAIRKQAKAENAKPNGIIRKATHYYLQMQEAEKNTME